MLRIRAWIRDPNSFFRIPDLGSQIHIFESLVTICWVKSAMILGELLQIFVIYLFKNKIIFNLVIFYSWPQRRYDNNFFLPPLFCGCGIRDPGWIKIRIRDPG
jgi:hypothetical protein